jgi:uncharacterized protein YkwD
MKRLLILISLLILVACGETPPVIPSNNNTPPTTTTSLDPELQTLLTLVNNARSVQRTCGSEGTFKATTPLTLNEKLSRAAQKHSQDMSINKQLSHTTQPGAINYAPGTTFDARIKQEGYTFKTAGENIAQGFSSPESVLKAWLASDGHCRNIMNPAFTEVGLGKTGSYWAQSFAAPQ